MSIIELIKMLGDMMVGFLTWKGSGVLILAVMSIPLAFCAFKSVMILFVRYCYEDKEKTKDNDR